MKIFSGRLNIFSAMYAWTMKAARHKYASYYLSFMSFAESVFFPIPVDVMLAPMSLAKPERAWYYAMLATIFSVLGGIVGYYLGFALYDSFVKPMIELVGYQNKLLTAEVWFEKHGLLVIFVASFTPIPYKVFTIAAGVMNMFFIPFVIVSIIGRGLRFFLVAGLMRWGGEQMENKLKTYIDRIGWAVVFLIVLVIIVLKV